MLISIFTLGFEEKPFSTFIFESSRKNSVINKALYIEKLFFDPEKSISPEIKSGKLISFEFIFKNSDLSLNLRFESLKFFIEKF